MALATALPMPTVARTVAQRTLYPLILGGSVAAAAGLLTVLPAHWVLAIVPVVAAAVIAVAERLLPYRAIWAESRGDTGLDIAYLGLNLAGGVATLPVVALLGYAAIALSQRVGADLWPQAWPIPAQVLLALLIYELGSYAFHTLCHRTALWRVHAVHHSVERLYWLNSLRSHPIDYFCAVLTTSGGLLLLGVGEQVFAYVTVIGVVNTLLQHANVDVETGWLDKILVTPRIHRWHHSTQVDEQRCNLGAVLLVWDLLFRTRLCPEQLPPDVVGPGHTDYPTRFWAQLRSPFDRALW